MRHIQLRDTIPLVLETLTEFGYSDGYMNTIKRHLNQVVDRYVDIGITHYTPGQYERFLSIISRKYETGNLRVDLFSRQQHLCFSRQKHGKQNIRVERSFKHHTFLASVTAFCVV